MVAGPIAAVMAIVVCFVPTLPAFAASAPVTAEPTLGDGGCTPVDPTFVTRPDLRPAGGCTNLNTGQAAPGYLFSSPNEGALSGLADNRGGPTIYATDGSVVWTKPRSIGDEQTFRVVTVGGRRLLAYWHGAWPVHNLESRGEFVLLDDHYHEVFHIRSIAGQPSLHELQITPAGTALVGAYTPVLSMVSGRPVVIFEYVISEVDFQHGNKVLFEWHSLDHVPLSESWQPVPPTLGSFDYFHGDAIDVLPGGDLLVSARYTSSVYRISRADGHVVWTLGNPHDGSGSFGPELLGSDDGWFCSQHEARAAGDDTIRVMDDSGGSPGCAHPGREVTIRIDQAAQTATVVSTIRDVPDRYSPQTHDQPLPNGDRLVSWGDTGQVTEYDASGQPVMDMTLGVFSYRVWKSEWQGFPDEPPVAVRDGSNLVVSWNGATEVARWQLLGGPDRDSLRKIGETVPRQGFETSMPVPPGTTVVAVQALGVDGAVLPHGEAVAGSPASAESIFIRMLRGPLWFLLNFGGFGLLVGWSVELGLLLGALLATVRLVRGQGGRRVARGFAGMTLLIILANLTGCLAQSFYPPMLYLNLVYPALFLITNLIGWPLIGVLTGLISGRGAQWRRDPVSMRAFRLAGWLWVGFFGLKLALQLPLYLAGEWVGMWIAKVLAGWPLWIVTVVATVVVVRRVRRTKEPEAPAVGTGATEEATVPRPAMA